MGEGEPAGNGKTAEGGAPEGELRAERTGNGAGEAPAEGPGPKLVEYANDEERGGGREVSAAAAEEEEDEDELGLVRRRRQTQERRRECPYLDTVNRQYLDFDFEKFCSVSLSNLNVYGCLVCGKYFQGRSKSTHAYTHALEAGHHVFINLHTEKVYCLPEGYEVLDPSLDDIKSVLNPRFSRDQLATMDKSKTWARALDGTDYIPGMVGLNNIKENDYVNVVVQSLMRVGPLRNFFLLPANYAHCASPLVQRYGELTRKIWHARNFKGQVSPHEFLQAVLMASNKRFRIDQLSDPVDFLSWLLNTLHAHLTAPPVSAHNAGTYGAAGANAGGGGGGGGEAGAGPPAKKRRKGEGGKGGATSIIHQCFQGELEVVKELTKRSAPKEDEEGAGGPGDKKKKGKRKGGGAEAEEVVVVSREVSRLPFLMLGLDLPPPPLFKDVMEKNIIPQVPLFNILAKFDGETITEVVRPQAARMRYTITRLPRYLILHMKRFKKNNFFVEKNPTLVNFPVKNLELKDFIPLPGGGAELAKKESPVQQLRSKYDLIANIVHDGKPGEGSYRVYVQRKSEETWYELQDLHRIETLPQMVALSEAYIQFYELQEQQ